MNVQLNVAHSLKLFELSDWLEKHSVNGGVSLHQRRLITPFGLNGSSPEVEERSPGEAFPEWLLPISSGLFYCLYHNQLETLSAASFSHWTAVFLLSVM